MAASKAALDLNAMISEDRQRRKNESLAKEIFGNRRASAPGGMNKRNNKPPPVPSLANRIGPIGGGVAKRSISTSTRPAASRSTRRPAGNVNAEWTHDLHDIDNLPTSRLPQVPPRGPKAAAHTNRNERIYSAVHASASSPSLNSQFNIVGTAKPGPEISIRGLAGPSMVMIRNLALGTTAADIESAMTPVGGNVLNCRIISERPKVIAELVFETKEGADNVVDTFNNQNADGHLLQVYHKSGPLPTSLKKKQPQLPQHPDPTHPRVHEQTETQIGLKMLALVTMTRTGTHQESAAASADEIMAAQRWWMVHMASTMMIVWTPMKGKAEVYTVTISCQAEVEALPTTETAVVEKTETFPTDERNPPPPPKKENHSRTSPKRR